MSLIRTENLCKSFGDLEVLKDVTLSVEQGEVISIRGVSGSGKTTLLSILGTILSPDQGVYRLQGEDITHQNAKINNYCKNKKTSPR